METEAQMIARQVGYDAHRALHILSTLPANPDADGWRKSVADEIIAICSERAKRRSPYLSAIAVPCNGKVYTMPFLKGGLRYTDTARDAWNAGVGSDA